MPRTKKVQATEPKAVEQPQQIEQTNEASPSLTKDDFIKAKATIKQYKEAQKTKPKRPCSDKQLAALAAGRAKNKRFANKTTGANQ